jgi:hypothetical protein
MELGPGVDAELLDEQLPGRPDGGESIDLAAGAIESQCVLSAEVFAVGLCGDQPLELGYERVVASERELGIVEQLDRAQPSLLKLWRFRLVDRLSREIGEGLAGPEVERTTEIVGCVRCTPGSKCSRRALDQTLEAREIELPWLERQSVPGPVPRDAFCPERLAQAVDVHLQRRDR